MEAILLQYLPQIFEIVILPLLGVLASFLIKFIETKNKEVKEKVSNETVKKYVDIATETIKACVLATNQTYVESLKAQGNFDTEAQEKAFALTYSAVLDLLAEEAKEYLQEVYGDLNEFLTTKIEAEVNLNK